MQRPAAAKAPEADDQPDRQPDDERRRRRDRGDADGDPGDRQDVSIATDDERDGTAHLVPDEPHLRASSRSARSGRRRVGRWRGDRPRQPGCRARSSAGRAWAAASFWPGRIRISVGVVGRRPCRVIVELRCSEDSAASRNATESTIPRSNRLTRPSSGSPARSSRLRARGVTEIMACLQWAGCR